MNLFYTNALGAVLEFNQTMEAGCLSICRALVDTWDVAFTRKKGQKHKLINLTPICPSLCGSLSSSQMNVFIFPGCLHSSNTLCISRRLP